MQHLILALFSLLLNHAEPQAKTPEDFSFTGYFSRTMPIDTTSRSCDQQTNALLFRFQRDSAHTTDNFYLYGLIKCPAGYDQSLFDPSKKVTLTYRQCMRKDLEGVDILNRYRFFNVNFYLITGIAPAP